MSMSMLGCRLLGRTALDSSANTSICPTCLYIYYRHPLQLRHLRFASRSSSKRTPQGDSKSLTSPRRLRAQSRARPGADKHPEHDSGARSTQASKSVAAARAGKASRDSTVTDAAERATDDGAKSSVAAASTLKREDAPFATKARAILEDLLTGSTEYKPEYKSEKLEVLVQEVVRTRFDSPKLKTAGAKAAVLDKDALRSSLLSKLQRHGRKLSRPDVRILIHQCKHCPEVLERLQQAADVSHDVQSHRNPHPITRRAQSQKSELDGSMPRTNVADSLDPSKSTTRSTQSRSRVKTVQARPAAELKPSLSESPTHATLLGLTHVCNAWNGRSISARWTSSLCRAYARLHSARKAGKVDEDSCRAFDGVMQCLADACYEQKNYDRVTYLAKRFDVVPGAISKPGSQDLSLILKELSLASAQHKSKKKDASAAVAEDRTSTSAPQVLADASGGTDDKGNGSRDLEHSKPSSPPKATSEGWFDRIASAIRSVANDVQGRRAEARPKTNESKTATKHIKDARCAATHASSTDNSSSDDASKVQSRAQNDAPKTIHAKARRTVAVAHPRTRRVVSGRLVRRMLGRLTRRVQQKGSSSSSVNSVESKATTKAGKVSANEAGLSDKANSLEKRGVDAYVFDSIIDRSLKLKPIEVPQKAVPTLAYGLDRVLFNPGVYHMQDPRSRVYNFDPYLETIMPVDQFDFDALKEYVTSSQDDALRNVARENNVKYMGSTSSMTSVLSHFHFLLSSWRPINAGKLSRDMNVDLESFTAFSRAPSAIFLKWNDGTYAIDADKKFDTANILSLLGKSMEKQLTLPSEDFEKYRRSNSHQITEEERNEPETFHYTTMGDFMMRSQLDAHDPRLPGTGMFDLKTRAVVSIRMDVSSWKSGVGYEIKGRFGNFESFEREYYDMIRAAFLKYSLQVRMGRMDGIFVAFHNIERMFGFQYIPVPEMDYALHGTEDTTLGDGEFKFSVALLNRVLDRATEKFPKTSIRLHFETRPTDPMPLMYIFAEPVSDKGMAAVQEKNKTAIAAFERDVMGMKGSDDQNDLAAATEDVVKDVERERIISLVEERIQSNSLTRESAAEAIEELVKNCPALKGHDDNFDQEVQNLVAVVHANLSRSDASQEQDIGDDAESASLEAVDLATAMSSVSLDQAMSKPEPLPLDDRTIPTEATEPTEPAAPLLAMVLTVQNVVNGSKVTRPISLSASDAWTVEYALGEIKDPKRAATVYTQCKNRREQIYSRGRIPKSTETGSSPGKANRLSSPYLTMLKSLALRGRNWRKKMDQAARQEPTKVAWDRSSQ